MKQLVLGICMLALCYCKPGLTANDIEKDVLTGAQILCILGTGLTDSKAIADACQIEQALAPQISKLLGDAKRAHVGRIAEGK